MEVAANSRMELQSRYDFITSQRKVSRKGAKKSF
jgi:hypothetical protein